MRRAVAAGAVLLGILAACTSLDGLSNAGDDAGVSSEAGPSDAGDAAPMLDATGADASVTRAEAYRKAILADTPLAYWRFEEISGDVAKDELGQYDGAYMLAPVLGEPGLVGSRGVRLAASSNAHIKVDKPDFRFSGNAPYAVEMWVVPSLFTDFQWLGGTETTISPRSGWSIFARDGAVLSYEVWGSPLVDGGTSNRRGFSTDGGALVTGRFQHVVFSYNGAFGTISVDGATAVTMNLPGAAPDTGVLTWGCRQPLVQCLSGWILDEIAVYAHVLNDNQVKAHYELGKPIP